MSKPFTQKILPDTPEFANSAGRLLGALNMLGSQHSYLERCAKIYGITGNSNVDKVRVYFEFMGVLGDLYRTCIDDVRSSTSISDKSREIIVSGISGLEVVIYNQQPATSPRALNQGEVATLQLAASMLETEGSLDEEDSEKIRRAIDELFAFVDKSDLSRSVRTALLEVIRLARNSLDQYTIHGARGFKDAFKRMLAELMELYARDSSVKDEPWWQSALDVMLIVDGVAGRLLTYQPLLEPGLVTLLALATS